jgi:Domain of unknown function (DUF4296)
MRAGLLIAFCCVLLAACKKKDKFPGNVLPPKKMQSVLQDMMRADQFLTDFVFSKDTSIDKKTESLKFYRQVFAIHQVSKEEFQQSFSYYKSHPQLLKVIMDSIGVNKKTEETAVPAAPTPVPDTIVRPGKISFSPDTPGTKKEKRPLRIE